MVFQPLATIRDRYFILLLDMLFFLGPCIILAVHMSGRGFTESLNAGAGHGYALLWVVAAALIYKYALIDGLARFTVAKGEHIFDALHGFPGPKNWETVLMTAIYFMEMIGYGGIALFAGLFLGLIAPGALQGEVLAIGTVAVIFLLLITRSFRLFRRIVTAMAAVMILGIGYCLLGCRVPAGEIPAGFLPSLTGEQMVDAMVMLGAVGSGLSLLLYSVWLKESLGDRHGPAYFRRNINKIRIVQGIAFAITGLLAFAFVTLGHLAPGGSDMAQGLAAAASGVPAGPVVLFATAYVILFGVVLTGAEGRARAISAILRANRITNLGEPVLYRLLVGIFSAMMVLVILLGNPQEILVLVSSLASVIFGVVGLMMIYLDSRLPAYARGSRAWTLVMGAGSFGFLLMALFREGSVITYALPLLEQIAVIVFLIYLLTRTRFFEEILTGTVTRRGGVLLVAACGLLSVCGTMSGFSIGRYTMTFPEAGPLIAGLLGGPVPGIATGLLAGGYAVFAGEPAAVPSAIGSVAAGALAGLAAIRWGRRRTYGGLVLLGFAATAVGLILPALIPGGYTVQEVSALFIPKLLACLLTLVMFRYFADEWEAGRRRLRKPLAERARDILRELKATPSLGLVAGGAAAAVPALILVDPAAASVLPVVVESLAVLGVITILLTRSRSFLSILLGRLSLTQQIWLIAVFSICSIYGTTGAIDLPGVNINFRTLGPMIAGLLGGPVVGLVTGLIGGLYRYTLGGETAIASMLGTIAAGLLAGYASTLWQGVLSYRRVVGLAVVVECVRLLVILPLSVFLTGSGDLLPLLEARLLPMVAVDALGLALFLFIIREETISIQSMDGIAAADPDGTRSQAAAEYASAVMAEANRIFTVIAGRLLSLSHRLAELEESEEARRLGNLIDPDELDEIFDEFAGFSDRYRGGDACGLQVAVMAGQITRRLERLLRRPGVAEIVDPRLIARVNRHLSAYMLTLRGDEEMVEESPVDLEPMIASLLHEVGTSPVSDEEVVESADDPDVFRRLLVARLAHVAVFEGALFSFRPGERVHTACSDPERLPDIVYRILESFALRGTDEIAIEISGSESEVRIRIAAKGPGLPDCLTGTAYYLLRRDLWLCRATIESDERDGDTAVAISLIPCTP